MILHGQVESSKGKVIIHVNCAWVEILLDGKTIWSREGGADNWYDKQHQPIADGMIALGSLLRSLGVS